jgi:GNAT superfamily N-acetyltransferase
VDVTPELSIRPGRDQDADEVYRLACVLATSAVPFRPSFEESFRVILGDARQVLLVAALTAQPGLVGYVHGLAHPAFHANGNVAWVEELVVDEQARGAGTGRALMAAFEDWTAGSAVDARYLAVATRRAAGFYRSLGYEESASYFKKLP